MDPAGGELGGHRARGLLERRGIPGGAGGEVHGHGRAAQSLMGGGGFFTDQHPDPVGIRTGDGCLEGGHGLGPLLGANPSVGPGAAGPGVGPHRRVQASHPLPVLDLGERFVGDGEASRGAAQRIPSQQPLVQLPHLLPHGHRAQQGIDVADHAFTPRESGSETAEYPPGWPGSTRCRRSIPRAASAAGSSARREVTTVGRRSCCARSFHAVNTAPPGAQSARLRGTSRSSTSTTTASWRTEGGTGRARSSAATSAKARPIGLTRPSASIRPSEYSSGGKSARERSTSWEHHQVTPHRFVQSAACRTARVQKSGASAASSTLSGAPISCSHTLRSGSVANAPDSSVRYSACRRLCGDMAPYFWAVPLKIQEWIAVTSPRREAWAGSKGCSSRYQMASYSACRASRWSCSGIAPSRESSQSPACWGVARMGAGWGSPENWLTSLPSVSAM